MHSDNVSLNYSLKLITENYYYNILPLFFGTKRNHCKLWLFSGYYGMTVAASQLWWFICPPLSKHNLNVVKVKKKGKKERVAILCDKSSTIGA